MKKALVRDGKIVDVVEKPYEVFSPEVAILYNEDVSDNIKPGARLIAGKWENEIISQPVEQPVPAQPAIVSVPDFLMLFTATEYDLLGKTIDKTVEQAIIILSDQKLQRINTGHFFIQRFLDRLIALSVIDEARKTQIVNGEAPPNEY